MGPKTSLSKEQFVHRKSTKSESKLESDCGLPLCLVKKHTVLQAAGNHRTLKIKKDVRKGTKRPKVSTPGNRVSERREKMERHLEKHQKEQEVKVQYHTDMGFGVLKVKDTNWGLLLMSYYLMFGKYFTNANN